MQGPLRLHRFAFASCGNRIPQSLRMFALVSYVLSGAAMQTLTPVNPNGETEKRRDQRPVVVFAHANGYPPGSYRALLTPLATKFRVFTVEHRPFWADQPAPARLDWDVYAEDLLETLRRETQAPVFFMGHSMGAVISVLAALKNPQACRGIVAIDPVLLPRRLWLPNQVLQRIGKDLPMVRSALRRPGLFASHQAAFDFYRAKRPFRRLTDESLWDYVREGHAEQADGSVVLRWSGAWEACVYRSAPPVIQRLRRLTLPMVGIVGADSEVISPLSLAQWRRAQPRTAIETLPGGHLLPLENPSACLPIIEDFLLEHDEAA